MGQNNTALEDIYTYSEEKEPELAAAEPESEQSPPDSESKTE